jgi:threonylcarbamoyladenosine tRNA methylthiotransferase MtaB
MTPYVHFSLQAGNDMILKRMKRRHLRADVVSLCERLKSARPEITFGADMIAGFPTETDEMFENGKSIISECPITWLHVFPYSPREGTPAAQMPPVNGKVIKARAKALREEGARVRAEHLDGWVGESDTALFEADGTGRLPDFTRVKVDSPPKAGQFGKVILTGHDGDIATGSLI